MQNSVSAEAGSTAEKQVSAGDITTYTARRYELQFNNPLKAVALHKAAAFFYVFSLGKLRRILYLLYAAMETL